MISPSEILKALEITRKQSLSDAEMFIDNALSKQFTGKPIVIRVPLTTADLVSELAQRYRTFGWSVEVGKTGTRQEGLNEYCQYTLMTFGVEGGETWRHGYCD